jgi:signal transduction histidine kinase
VTARLPIRTRLTVLYGAAFFLAGLLLIAVMYAQFRYALDTQFAVRVRAAERFGERFPLLDRRTGATRLIGQLTDEARLDREAALRAMTRRSVAALLGSGLLAFGLGWVLAGRALRPLHDVTDTARRVAQDRLHERVPTSGPRDEITDLADTFNAMLERLDRSFDAQHRFVANASHELRTPLTTSRALVEVAMADPGASEDLKQLGPRLLEVNQRQERLIEGLLALASSEQELTDVVEVDLAEVARHVAAGTGASVSAASAVVRGDAVLLERMVGNLVDNALRYNTPGGWVALDVTGDGTVTVENTGPVVPPEAVPGLFEPFRRLDRATGGAGLGLSIVRAIAAAHGGTAEAVARPDGGLVVRVRLRTVRG